MLLHSYVVKSIKNAKSSKCSKTPQKLKKNISNKKISEMILLNILEKIVLKSTKKFENISNYEKKFLKY